MDLPIHVMLVVISMFTNILYSWSYQYISTYINLCEIVYISIQPIHLIYLIISQIMYILYYIITYLCTHIPHIHE